VTVKSQSQAYLRDLVQTAISVFTSSEGDAKGEKIMQKPNPPVAAACRLGPKLLFLSLFLKGRSSN
jgi:hypothetical protein